MQDKLVEGLIFCGPGSCIECGSPLVVVDCETSVMELDPDGIPRLEETYYRCKAICSNCGKEYTHMKRKNGGYVPYTEASEIIDKMDIADRAKNRVTELNALGAKGNPLAIMPAKDE